jgi:hypothetical protein
LKRGHTNRALEDSVKKSLPLAALLGATGLIGLIPDADAAAFDATLISVRSYSNSGFAVWNGTLDTSTWTFDTATGTAVQTGGVYSRLTKAGSQSLMRHTMTGVTLSSGAATGATWACIEGTFGGGGGNTGGVGASVCGNYNWGANLTNQSTYTPVGLGATVTLGGDDGAFAAPQSLVNSYSSMVATSLGGGAWSLHNTNGPIVSTSTSGYDFVFQVAVPVPPAVWLFGSALGLMGVLRRKTATV